MVGNARLLALASIERQDYPTFIECKVKIEEDLVRAEREVTIAFKKLDELVAARNSLFSAKNEVETAMRESEFGRYIYRRMRASYFVRSPEVRSRIFARDGHHCLRCGSPEELTVDHIKPVVKGGGDEDENLQTLCRKCNSAKGASEIRFVPSIDEQITEVAS